MIIQINTTKDRVFKQYLHILNCVQDKKKKLSPAEINLLATLLYIDDKYSHLNKDKRDIMLFSSNTKKKVREFLEVDIPSFNNTLCSLRRKQLITKERLLFRPVIKNNKMQLVFQLNIDDDKTNEAR
jgi:hypothetical protein